MHVVHSLLNPTNQTIGSFRLKYEYEIEYEYEFSNPELLKVIV